jgi:hypothetical protein
LALFHEIAGPILASAAVVLAIYVFKITLDYQSYKDIDSDYTDILKIGIEYPHFRNPNWTKEYNRKKRSGEEEEKVLKYEQVHGLEFMRNYI